MIVPMPIQVVELECKCKQVSSHSIKCAAKSQMGNGLGNIVAAFIWNLSINDLVSCSGKLKDFDACRLFKNASIMKNYICTKSTK